MDKITEVMWTGVRVTILSQAVAATLGPPGLGRVDAWEEVAGTRETEAEPVVPPNSSLGRLGESGLVPLDPDSNS